MPRKNRCGRLQELSFQSWGGARRGAGRRRSSARARVAHARRPGHDVRNPVHVTLRLRDGLPSLRAHLARARIFDAFADARGRFGLRLNEFSVQSNHVHLIVEADDGAALSRGMKGLAVRVARALRTPREVRAALVYVLQNARHHGLRMLGVDPCSSGPWFDGWRQGIVLACRGPGMLARSWLLREGWRRHGLIGIEESPAGCRW